MSKELEVLVDGKIEYYKATLSLAEGLGRLEEGRRLRETIEHFEEIKQALTPPTEQEVCEALSEQLKKQIKISKNKHGITFNYTETKKTIISKNYNLINIKVQLPPHLITMICKFFEKESERDV